MAEAADTVPAQQPAARVATTTAAAARDVSAPAWLQQVLALLFPSNLAAKAALFALVVALLPLLPAGQAQAPRIWELPHLLLLGIIISYGVFGQKSNADAAEVAAAAADAKLPVVVDDEAAVEAYVTQMMQGSLVFEEHGGGDDGDGASKDDGGVQLAWSSQYLPDDPLVVVADTSAPGTTTSGNGVITDAGEKPLLLPVRKLKPAAAEESAPPATPAGDMMMSDGSGIEEEEEEEEEEEQELLLGPKAGTGYDVVREHAIPSPSSVLDADLTLSPSSPPLLPPPPPPPPPPFLGRGRRSSLLKAKARSFNEFGALSRGDRSPNGSLVSHSAAGSKQFRSRSAVQATRSAFGRRYDPVVPIDDEADDETLHDEMVAASDISSFTSDLDDDDTIKEEENSCEDNGVDEDEDDGNSCDEELFELAMRPGPEGETETETEVEDEVDRKADEFIAKFREQIRMQRVETARRRPTEHVR